jgi:hypothetical protein
MGNFPGESHVFAGGRAMYSYDSFIVCRCLAWGGVAYTGTFPLLFCTIEARQVSWGSAAQLPGNHPTGNASCEGFPTPAPLGLGKWRYGVDCLARQVTAGLFDDFCTMRSCIVHDLRVRQQKSGMSVMGILSL